MVDLDSFHGIEWNPLFKDIINRALLCTVALLSLPHSEVLNGH